MSGGALTDYNYGTYVLDEWADKIEHENVILAEQMRDMRALLDDYDYYLSGDTNEQDAEASWVKYRTKWMDCPVDTVTEIMRNYLERILVSFKKGYYE